MSSSADVNLSIPDTHLVKEADGIVKNALTPELYDHSLRSHLLAMEFSRQQGLEADEENLALAFLFHDIGFCKPYKVADCAFQVSSSKALKSFLEANGVAPERIVPMMEAIELHMQLRPRWEKGNEVALLHIGAWMDVTGLRIWKTTKTARQSIYSRYPKRRFMRHFSACMLKSMTSVRSSLGIMMPSMCRSESHFRLSGAQRDQSQVEQGQ